MATETEKIKQNVVNHLCRDGRVDASDIEVQVDGSRVTLSGTVPDRVAYCTAYDAAKFTGGVTAAITNKLHIEK